MKAHMGCRFALALAAMIVAAGCGKDDAVGQHEIWFSGYVFDGATGAHVTTYEVSLIYRTTTVKGTVEADGRYVMGPLPAWNDFAVVISAAGYRAFRSYNASIKPPTAANGMVQGDVYAANTTQSFQFDAYVFPEGLQTSQADINIVKNDVLDT